MNLSNLIEAKRREIEARRHGRHIKLEQELNAIGLSLFAPPLETTHLVQFNEWEGHYVPEAKPQIYYLLDAVLAGINDIDSAAPERVHSACLEAIQKLSELAKYIHQKQYE